MQLLRAILFDLDGTLLPMDTGEFMQEYLKELSRAVQPFMDPGQFTRSLLASTGAMIADTDPALTNAEVFWNDFRNRLGDDPAEIEQVLEEFYNSKFDGLRRVVRPVVEQAREAVTSALNRGCKVVVATNPVFPLLAVQYRIKWAGLMDIPWDLVTSYENMHFCKPQTAYYLEIARRLKVRPEDCLMVGNDVREDLAAGRVGMKTFLVDSCLIDCKNIDPVADGRGSLSQFTGWLNNNL